MNIDMRIITTITLTILLQSVLLAATIGGYEIVKSSPDELYGRLVVSVDGRQVTVADQAARAWPVDGGQAIAYSGPEGAGGFENEGQALWIYNAATGKKRKLVSEYYVIMKLTEARSNKGRLALLLMMRDGGLGAKHVAVVNPKTGQVWREDTAFFAAVRNGRVAVADYEPRDFESDNENPGKPRRMLYLDLDCLLDRPASTTKPVGVK